MMVNLKDRTLHLPGAHVHAFLCTHVSPASLRLIAEHSSGLQGDELSSATCFSEYFSLEEFSEVMVC